MTLSDLSLFSVIYGLLFLTTSCTLVLKVKQIQSASAINIFWSLVAFSTMKSTSIFMGIAAQLISPEFIIAGRIFNTLTTVTCIISNVFLFHFGISVLTHNTSMKLDYKVFPIILFGGFMAIYFLGVIEFSEIEEISRYSFGFNGALLGSIGCFNIYKIKQSANEKLPVSGFITCGIALILIAFTEGIITKGFLGIQLNNIRLLSAAILFISSFYFADLMKDKKKNQVAAKSKIGFV